MRRPETILKIRKKVTFLKVTNKSIIYKSLKDFASNKKKTCRAVVFTQITLPDLHKHGNTDEISKNLEKMIPSNKYLKDYA